MVHVTDHIYIGLIMITWISAFLSAFLAICLSLSLLIHTGPLGFVMLGAISVAPLIGFSHHLITEFHS